MSAEDFWYVIPAGIKVEIWSYNTEIIMESGEMTHKQKGKTELYFINDSGTVSCIGFYLDGAVSEGSRH